MKITTKQKIEVKVESKKETSQSPKSVELNYTQTPCKSCGDKKK